MGDGTRHYSSPDNPTGRGEPSTRRSLAQIAAEFAAGRATPVDVHEAFLAATVFCEAGEKPGFVAVGPSGSGVIPVFTSERELMRARGPVRWFATWHRVRGEPTVTAREVVQLVRSDYVWRGDRLVPGP